MSKQSKKARMIAFDQASVKTGYAVFDGTDLIKWGLLEADSKEESGARIVDMAGMIEELVDKYNPSEIVFEGIQKQQSIQIVILLARLQGCIIDICRKKKAAYSIYQPTTWRSNIGFDQGNLKRKELKQQAVDYVKKSYGLNVSEDVCEAICIGLAHLKQCNMLQ